MRLVHDKPAGTTLRAARVGHAAPRGPRPGRRDESRRAGPLVVLAIALVALVAGSIALGARLRESSSTPPSQITLHGLTATISTAGWVAMDAHSMDQGAGYQMPAQMMPGAPEGDRMRLGVPITLVNTDRGDQRFDLAEEFTVIGGVETGPVPLHSDTFGLLSRLAPGSGVNGILYFDIIVPGPSDPPLVLRWARNDDTVELTIPMAGGAADPHEHD